MKLESLANQIYTVAKNEARMENHEYITPEHFLYATLMFNDGREIISDSGGEVKRISKNIQEFFEKYMTSAGDMEPTESISFTLMLEDAIELAKDTGKTEVSVADVIAAMFDLQDSFAVYIMRKNGVEKDKIQKSTSTTNKIEEDKQDELSKQISSFMDIDEPNEESKPLKRFTVNLVKKAENGDFLPFIGRNEIIEDLMLMLCRKTKNNPILTGDAGVGKTAIVEGLAQRIFKGQVPESLKDSNIYCVDISSVMAGTRYRGDFEEKLISILEEAKAEKNAIIYLDEIHTVVGAGSTSNSALDASSILKPYLVNSGIRFIGSTTFEEYKKFFERDQALLRRFQKIDIKEPTLEEAKEIIDGVSGAYESFHSVKYTKEALAAACELSQKYIFDRKLPDIAIDILDQAAVYAAHVAVHKPDKNKYVPTTVALADIEYIVSKIAKIPKTSISQDEIKALHNLDNEILKVVFGQDEAVNAVANAIKASRSGLNVEHKPIASLLFLGSTGVGKTEVAKTLASVLDIKLTRFDMSEYQEAHSVARLIGSPPGYVGYTEGGLLIDAIRKTPNCVLLLDEIEKAHPNIMNILLQVMDYGKLTDTAGKKADFRNVVIIMTSNAGARDMDKQVIGFDNKKDITAMYKEVSHIFSPEFRNRLDEIIYFNPINYDMAIKIAKKTFNTLQNRINAKDAKIMPSPAALDYIVRKGLLTAFGAREIERIIEKDIKKQIVDFVLFGNIHKNIYVDVNLADDRIVVSTGDTEINFQKPDSMLK